jgi:hypothetical protein
MREKPLTDSQSAICSAVVWAGSTAPKVTTTRRPPGVAAQRRSSSANTDCGVSSRTIWPVS